ncbi:uncharacterized protein LOC133783688 [Humulus lupulus]|uniref:uncharacterized protein LOC133783688 n=1 Tax=Humulus lupulus TaxID=3486 RepID=UPI002B410F28|nr:uncharacterized protein LOC133783688 [Humulus lupulus]
MTRITKHLPLKFCVALKSYLDSLDPNVLAKAFEQIGNSMVVASVGTHVSKSSFPVALHVDVGANCCKNDIVRTLFLKSVEVSTRNFTAGENPPMNLCFWEIFEAINSEGNGRDQEKLTSNAQTIKVELEKYIPQLEEKISSRDMVDMVYELKQLSVALDARDISLAKELAKQVQSRKLRMEGVLNKFFHKHTTDCDNEGVKTSTSEKISNSDKGEPEVSEGSNESTNPEPSAAPESKAKPKEKEGCHIL